MALLAFNLAQDDEEIRSNLGDTFQLIAIFSYLDDYGHVYNLLQCLESNSQKAIVYCGIAARHFALGRKDKAFDALSTATNLFRGGNQEDGAESKNQIAAALLIPEGFAAIGRASEALELLGQLEATPGLLDGSMSPIKELRLWGDWQASIPMLAGKGHWRFLKKPSIFAKRYLPLRTLEKESC